jgi:acetyl-CoA carboxylase biotin carboxyl carrier protein
MTSDFRDSTTLPDLRYVRELARVFKQYELGEIEIESGDQRILLRRGGGGEITSPFVGTFYASPSPGAAAFVKVGQTISPGTVLCIVEAMKLMNEIESEVAGVIVEITGTNGKPVEYGDRLFKIKVA